MDHTVQQCLAWCQPPRRPHMLVTVNAATLVEMRRHHKLRRACHSSQLVVPDGMSVVWATKLVGTPVAERVAGVELMERLLEMGSEEKLRFYFLGSKREVLDKLVQVCRTRYPGVTIVGTQDGYFREDQQSSIVERIQAADADILLIGMPTPFKEVWCHENKEALGVPVQIGVGGSFDVITGTISRAPVWMQRIGMEWVWRLMMEPRRLWKRYLIGNTTFIWLTLCSAFRRRDPAPRHHD